MLTSEDKYRATQPHLELQCFQPKLVCLISLYLSSYHEIFERTQVTFRCNILLSDFWLAMSRSVLISIIKYRLRNLRCVYVIALAFHKLVPWNESKWTGCFCQIWRFNVYVQRKYDNPGKWRRYRTPEKVPQASTSFWLHCRSLVSISAAERQKLW